jgi:hypothetical protein
MTRYSARSASSGNITLNSARERGNTQQFWYYINLGPASCGRDKWAEFDIREIAKRLGVPLPNLIDDADLKACAKLPPEYKSLAGQAYENLLHRTLQRVADWCDEHDVLAVIGEASAPNGS